jgi:4-hydroxy-tetrahydrodipicolinate synthase
MSVDLHGIIPPLVTPLDAEGGLALDGIPALVEHVLAGGVHGIFATGSQGEAFALTPDERAQVWQAVVMAVDGRVPVIAGTGAITTREAVALSRRAEQVGADAIAPITPFFITPTQDELYRYYADIAAAVSLPVLGYSNPGRAGGVRLTPETLARLAEDIPHFAGVKDTSGDLAETAAILRACPPAFAVFVGRDTLIYGALCHGAAGAVGMTVNVLPELVVAIYDAFQAGDHARARALQDRLAAFHAALPGFGSYPAPVKAALDIMGLPAGPPRLPVAPLDAEQRARLRDLLVRMEIAI